jgi:broad specificity phosphatase PhoE
LSVPTLYLIRHAKAEARDRWEAPDDERPLTRRGHEQARLIASWLADLGGRRPSRILTSSAVRCRQTVEELAAAVGLNSVDARWLLEGSDPAQAYEALRRLTRRLDPPSGIGGPVAACSHGDVIWGVLERLHRLGVDLGPQPDVAKGSTWIIEFPSRELPVARYFQPDAARR